MTKILSAAAALTFTLALTSAATAQDIAPDISYEFEDHDVEGGYRSPLGDPIFTHPRSHRTSLVRPRLHFVPELLKTVETI
ncbi:MAG TPA: hypothetical protein ENK57_10895 [Polyangiaceae bacterium]|nr:hypothetical protein [Polyangiaceae bacterium]